MKRTGYILLISLMLLQVLIPPSAYLQTNSTNSKLLTILNNSRSSALVNILIKPLQQSSNLRLLGPNNENQPVVNEGNSIKLKLADTNGNAINDSSITFTSDSPDVASVDNQGNIQGKLFGFATVTAKRGNESTQIFVVVARVQQAVGMMLTGQMEKDSGGGLYLSDPSRNIIIKKADAFAAPAPFAGNGMAGSAGDEGDPNSAQLNGPVGVAVDNGAFGGVYVADSLNHKIRKIEGKKIRTVLGTGSAGIKPELIINDEVSFNSGTDISLNFPQGVAVDVGGQVFVADSDNAAIYQVDFGRKRVKLFAGQPGNRGSIDGKGRQAMFTRPIALNLNGSTRILNILDQDPSNKMTTVRQIAPDGTVKTIKKKKPTFADGGINPLADDDITFTNGRAISSDGVGNVYVIDDTGANLITFPANQDPQIVSLAQPGQGITFNQATSITVQGTQSFVVDARAVSTNQAVKVVSVGAPKIDSLSKDNSRLDQPGEEIVINGRNFSPETQLVLGDSIVTNFIVVNATQIKFRVPQQNTSGIRTLTINTRGGVAQRPFNITPKPFSEIKDGEIITIAGGLAYVGDGSFAVGSLITPSGVTIDGAGNLFIADSGNNRIRRVDASTGIITTIAGSGSRGFSEDGSFAITGSLGTISEIVIDTAGNFFITEGSDKGGGRVRRIDASTGIITTVAGGGDSPFGEGIPALSAQLAPSRIAIDGVGNLFISEGNRIRRVDANTGIITTIVGSNKFGFSGDGGLATSASLTSPSGMAIDGTGNLFIADFGNARIRRVDASTGIITTVAGSDKFGFSGDGGLATNAGLAVQAVTVDTAGNLFIADFGNNRIRKVEASTGIITTFVGGGSNFIVDGVPATFTVIDPSVLAVDKGGNLFVGDSGNNKVRRIDVKTGIISTIAGNGTSEFSGDGGPAISAGLFVAGIAMDSADNLLIADGGRIRKVTTATGIINTIAGNGTSEFSGDGGPAISAGLSASGLVVDTGGNIFVSDFSNNRIRRVDANTKIITTVAGGGNSIGFGDGGLATSGRLISPVGLAIDKAGNLFIAELANRIRKVDVNTKIITTIAGNGMGASSGDGGFAVNAKLVPKALTVDAEDNLFISDLARIRRITASTGIITTVAGDGRLEFGGDGGHATSASLFPEGIAIDKSGNLFIADRFNGRIRVVKKVNKVVIVQNPVIREVRINNLNFLIEGSGFGVAANVRINGKDVSKFIRTQTADFIALKGKQKQLNTVFGVNSLTVTVNGVVSNTFTFNFFASNSEVFQAETNK